MASSYCPYSPDPHSPDVPPPHSKILACVNLSLSAVSIALFRSINQRGTTDRADFGKAKTFFGFWVNSLEATKLLPHRVGDVRQKSGREFNREDV